jgi:hypothetical protein
MEGRYLRKYFLLFSSVLMIFLSFYRLNIVDKPRVGPVGEGSIPLSFWISISSLLIAGVCFLILSLILIVRDRRGGR